MGVIEKIPGKFKHVLLTGNLCTERELNFFRTLCNDVVCVRGCFDEVSCVCFLLS